jgi:hypothetical protein
MLLASMAFGLYSVIDQGVSLTYLRQDYDETKDDLKQLMKIINETDLTEDKVTKLVTASKDERFVHFDGDRITSGRITMIFKDNRLNKIERNW